MLQDKFFKQKKKKCNKHALKLIEKVVMYMFKVYKMLEEQNKKILIIITFVNKRFDREK